jgi:hypothetical protein
MYRWGLVVLKVRFLRYRCLRKKVPSRNADICVKPPPPILSELTCVPWGGLRPSKKRYHLCQTALPGAHHQLWQTGGKGFAEENVCFWMVPFFTDTGVKNKTVQIPLRDCPRDRCNFVETVTYYSEAQVALIVSTPSITKPASVSKICSTGLIPLSLPRPFRSSLFLHKTWHVPPVKKNSDRKHHKRQPEPHWFSEAQVALIVSTVVIL